METKVNKQTRIEAVFSVLLEIIDNILIWPNNEIIEVTV